jgi:hypothetical protein
MAHLLKNERGGKKTRKHTGMFEAMMEKEKKEI